MNLLRTVTGIDKKRQQISIIGGIFLVCMGLAYAISESDRSFWSRASLSDIERLINTAVPILLCAFGFMLLISTICRSKNKIDIYDTKIRLEAISEPFYKGGRFHAEIPYEKIDSILTVESRGELRSSHNLRINLTNGQEYTFAIKDLEETMKLIQRQLNR